MRRREAQKQDCWYDWDRQDSQPGVQHVAVTTREMFRPKLFRYTITGYCGRYIPSVLFLHGGEVADCTRVTLLFEINSNTSFWD